MYKIEQKYRATYTGEEVTTQMTGVNNEQQYEKEWVPNNVFNNYLTSQAIMGGDNVFPDGPDVLTVTVRLVEDPGFVSTSNLWNVTGRISWSERQA